MSKILKIVVGMVIFIVAFIIINRFVSVPNNIDIIVEEIRFGFSGKIIDKYAVRDTPPTHLKIKVDSTTEIDISPYEEIVKEAEVGDSIYKPENENIAFLIDKKGNKKKFFYTKISYETRKHKDFPPAWRNKWLESSEWDKNN